MARIFIAAGHGGSDPGAVSSCSIERDTAIFLVGEAINIINRTGQTLGKELVVVPNELSLEPEVAWINANLSSVAYDVAINVHLNSNTGTPGTGTETWYGLKQLAEEVNEEVVKVLGLPNRGVKQNDLFWFNRAVKCASCILEICFNNNPGDVAVVREKGALALAKAIVRASNGVWKDPQPTTTTSTTTSTSTSSTSTSTSSSMSTSSSASTSSSTSSSTSTTTIQYEEIKTPLDVIFEFLTHLFKWIFRIK